MAIRRRIRTSPSAPKRAAPKRTAPVRASGGDEKMVAPAADKRLADYGDRVLEALKSGEERIESMSWYELVRELGEGGMGTVFLAHHVSESGIKKPVAVKVIKDTHDDASIEKLVEEARLLTQLSQGTIVELLALESKELTLPARRDRRTGRTAPAKKSKLFFMVMEYVDGPGLDAVLKSHNEKVLMMNPMITGFMLNKAVLALSEAHDLTDEKGNNLNLVHRDISPSNILFMAKGGITKLADFGVAKAFGDFEGGDVNDARSIVGKPKYMAPEQLEGRAVAASDIWALGVIGYECLTGYPPYRALGDTMRDKVRNLKKQFEHELRAPAEILTYRNERFNFESLSEILMACLAPDPAERPTSSELNGLLEGEHLYEKGLGPTNQTLAAYLRLLDYAVGEGEVIPPPEYEDSDDAERLRSTLWLEDPFGALRRRRVSEYDADFVAAVKAKEANPCLRRGADGAFAPA